MNFQETLDYMYRLLPMYQRVGKVAFKKDLTNTIRLLEILGNPEKKFKSIHIAGTNGKGSSAHMLASVLQSAGYKTGLYTSPHLKRFTERIRIDGLEVDESYVCAFIERLRGHIETIQPSFFEITVAMAFDYFARNAVDVAVIEVGLGGRFDSTNVIVPMVSLITSISYDHMDMLGNTLKEIAFEKAGIIKPDVPVVISETQPEIQEVFISKAVGMHSGIYFADQEFNVSGLHNHNALGCFNVQTSHGNFELLTDLAGIYQAKNIPGVLKVIGLLRLIGFRITDEHLKSGLKNVVKQTGLKGRWQKINEKPFIICDTAHNEAGVALLMQQVRCVIYNHLHIIWGSVEGKELEKIFKFLPVDASYYFCQPNIPRGLKAEALRLKAAEFGLSGLAYEDVNLALQAAKSHAGSEDLILISGSNFIVAELNEL